MAAIDRGQPTYDRLALLARAWGTTPDGAVTRLIDEFQGGGGGSAVPATPSPSGGGDGGEYAVPIHAVYDGVRIPGRYYPSTGAVEVLAGKHDGKRFRSPSGAAVAVVKSLNRRVNPNRNGWSFWVVDSTGEILESIRYLPL